jgi:hypothetical protein
VAVGAADPVAVAGVMAEIVAAGAAVVVGAAVAVAVAAIVVIVAAVEIAGIAATAGNHGWLVLLPTTLDSLARSTSNSACPGIIFSPKEFLFALQQIHRDKILRAK